MSRKENLIVGIQGLRAVAAFCVLLQHSIFFTCVAKHIDYLGLYFADFGSVGVYLFFVISGYVMVFCLPQGRYFMINRIARIYLPFWMSIILSGLIAYFLNQEWVFNFYSITLLPASNLNNSYHVPYWTLVYELVFYVIVYFFITIRFSYKQIEYALLVWAALIVLTSQFHLIPVVNTPMPGSLIFFSPICLLFIAGALYGLIGRDKLKNIPSISLLIDALVLFLIANSLPLHDCVRILCLCVTYVFFLELSQRIQYVPAVMEKLGDYSYGLYLTHALFISIATHLIEKYFSDYRFALCFLFVISTGLLGGVVFGMLEHYFYKNKIKIWLRSLSLGPSLGSSVVKGALN